jgi:hypothetical protein
MELAAKIAAHGRGWHRRRGTLFRGASRP